MSDIIEYKNILKKDGVINKLIFETLNIGKSIN